MSQVRIFEPELIQRTGYNGFYRHFLSALVEHAGARGVADPRPTPRLTQPREHESCWVEWGGALVFFDMSDHVQMFDLEALRRCSVYFKANLHRGLARRILAEAELTELESKLAPFLFFTEQLDAFVRDAGRRRRWRLDRPRYDICFVMGVYENPVRDGARSPFEYEDEPITPAAVHFWIRWHWMHALRDAGIPGFYRLTSRGATHLEDGVNVWPNLGRRAFSRALSRGRLTAVCTFPHAVFPWKASESFALGRPILVDQMPLTETPAPFRPVAGEQVIEALPRTGAYDAATPLADPASYRVLTRIPPTRFHERAQWLRELLEDRDRLDAMGESCRAFAARAYDKRVVAEYIAEEVGRRTGVAATVS